MKAIIERNDDLAEQVKATRLAPAQLGFELFDGSRVLFVTRSRAATRGFSGDLLLFDEAHFLSEPAHAAMRPTLGGRSAEGNVQTIYSFSAVDQNRHPDGVVASRLHKRGIEGSDGLAYVEFSAELVDSEGMEMKPVEVPPAACVDPEILMAANPGCPNRVSLEFLNDEAANLDTASHACEHLGVGDWHDEDQPGQSQLDLARFAALVDVDAMPETPWVGGFDVSRDRRRGAVAQASPYGDNKIVARIDLVAPGVDWIPGRLHELGASKDEDAFAAMWSSCEKVVCDGYQEPLAAQIHQTTGIECDLLDRAGVGQSCARLVDLVREGRLVHDGNPLVMDALKAATTVSVGDSLWAFNRRTSSGDLSPLYALIFAVSGVDEDDAASGVFIY